MTRVRFLLTALLALSASCSSMPKSNSHQIWERQTNPNLQAVQPVHKAGKTVGLKIETIDPDSDFGKQGFKSGDILISCNEKSVSEFTSTTECLAPLDGAEKVANFVVERNGLTLNLKLVIPPLPKTTTHKCTITVSFGSTGSGIDDAKFDQIVAYLKDNPNIPYISQSPSQMEGETSLCIEITDMKNSTRIFEDLEKMAPPPPPGTTEFRPVTVERDEK
jgi:hypothetical protein